MNMVVHGGNNYLARCAQLHGSGNVVAHRPRKRFGQNFLVDSNVVHKIMQVVGAQPHDRVVEIGPGRGVLTKEFISCGRVASFDAVEIDRDLVALLTPIFAQHPSFHLHLADALSFDFAALHCGGSSRSVSSLLRVVGNLPYNITTPLLFHLISYASTIQDLHFMVQREVAARLVAAPGAKEYGRLSVMAQYHCKMEELFIVPPAAFSPAPQVYSSFVRFVPHSYLYGAAYAKSSVDEVDAVGGKVVADLKVFEEVVREAFNQRRKSIRNSLKNLVDAVIWSDLHIDSQLRPEQLSLENFVMISNVVAQKKTMKNSA